MPAPTKKHTRHSMYIMSSNCPNGRHMHGVSMRYRLREGEAMPRKPARSNDRILEKSINTASVDSPESARRNLLLESAITIFSRFGYRKTSMEEIARAAGFSRQGVYFYYATKEDLFRGTILYVYESRLRNAETLLTDRSRPIEERLTLALDAWYGQYIGKVQAEASDLIESSSLHAADVVAPFNQRLDALMIKVLTAEKELVRAYRIRKLQPSHLAKVLHSAALGLKETSLNHKDFLEGVRAIVAVLFTHPST